MTVKDLVLRELEGGAAVQGQTLADKLGVSRNAVWKAVNSLISDGCDIQSGHGGYRLIGTADVLTVGGVRSLLPKTMENIPIILLKTVNSTNTYAKKIAADNAASGTLVIAEQQTEGRGRRGHTFYSPEKSGLYMSVILHPEHGEIPMNLLTVCAGNAVCKAVEMLGGGSPKIKWVNDIFLDSHKICGILTEGTVDYETGEVGSAVVGIGVNISTIFPPELQNIAGGLAAQIPRAPLAAAIYRLLFEQFTYSREEIIAEYKSRSLVLGRQVVFSHDNSDFHATAIDIDNTGALVVKLGEEIRYLNSGEISINIT